MTAFLFIPATVAGIDVRRVDPANFASLFGEHEEPVRRSPARRMLLKTMAAALLLLVLVGDTLLVTRPGAIVGLSRAVAHLTL